MQKIIIKILLLTAVIGGVYFYLNPDRMPFSFGDATAHIPEVSYQDIVNGADQAMDAIQTAQDGASAALQLAEDAKEVVDEAMDLIDEVSGDDENDASQDAVDGGNLEDVTPDEVLVPEDFQLAVPFTPQAPHADWNLPYQEACEEAAVYMISGYYQGMSSGLIDPRVANAEILDLVDFQTSMYGFYLDTTAQETARLLDDYYGVYGQVVDNPTVDEIKEQIAGGHPVIVLAAGQELGNPYFSGAGPLYHALVIKGYTATKFITNDPGTKHGNGFVYDIGVIMDAIGDWNGGDPANGAKRVIFTSPTR